MDSTICHAIEKSQHSTSRFKKITCESLDDFVVLCDKMGRLKGSQEYSKQFSVKTTRPSSFEDAQSIVNIYEKVYHGHYPYAEMLDENWIFTSFTDPNYFWGVFRIEDNIPEYGKIVGCFTIALDYTNRTAYMRGLNMLPEYQKKVGVKELSFSLGEQFFSLMSDKVDKWYAECITAHPISQVLSRTGGSHCEAIFLNKDYFMGKKSSVAMMVGYWDKTLFDKRQSPDYLLPEIIPFYKQTCNMHNLDDNIGVINNPEFEVDISELYRVTKNAKTIIEQKNHNYFNIELIDEDTGSYIKAVYTPSVKNIEKIRYHCPNKSTLMGLFMLLKVFAQIRDVEYIEWQVRASDYNLAQFLLIHEFQVQGYVPAWIPTTNQEKYEDVIIMGWAHQIPNYDSIKTYDEGYTLLDLILVNNYPRCDLDLTLFDIMNYPAHLNIV